MTRTLGPYHLEGLLGEGGMGAVHRARHLGLGRIVALKLLHPDVVHTTEGLRRFEREMKVAAQLAHPGVVRVLDGGVLEGTPFLAMELLSAGSLDAVWKRRPLLSPGIVLALGAKIAAGLAYLHGQGIVHRDVKPSNVMFGDDGLPRLVDFGIARPQRDVTLTAPGTVLGTLAFLSPEILSGAPPSPSDDLWALGCTLYGLLSGRLPFVGDGPGEVIDSILTRPVLPLDSLRSDVPVSVGQPMMDLLRRDPSHRTRGALELGESMERLLEDLAGADPEEVLVAGWTTTMTPLQCPGRGAYPARSLGPTLVSRQPRASATVAREGTARATPTHPGPRVWPWILAPVVVIGAVVFAGRIVAPGRSPHTPRATTGPAVAVSPEASSERSGSPGAVGVMPTHSSSSSRPRAGRSSHPEKPTSTTLPGRLWQLVDQMNSANRSWIEVTDPGSAELTAAERSLILDSLLAQEKKTLVELRSLAAEVQPSNRPLEQCSDRDLVIAARAAAYEFCWTARILAHSHFGRPGEGTADFLAPRRSLEESLQTFVSLFPAALSRASRPGALDHDTIRGLLVSSLDVGRTLCHLDRSAQLPRAAKEATWKALDRLREPTPLFSPELARMAWELATLDRGLFPANPEDILKALGRALSRRAMGSAAR